MSLFLFFFKEMIPRIIIAARRWSIGSTRRPRRATGLPVLRARRETMVDMARAELAELHAYAAAVPVLSLPAPVPAAPTTAALPIPTPPSRQVDVGVVGETPLQVQYIPARPTPPVASDSPAQPTSTG